MKKTNYHTHTKRCMHANGTDADYVKAALDAGLDVLGFSDHGPFPDNRFDFRMPYADLDEYLTCIDALRPTVSFPILKGLEIEYCPDSLDYYSFLFKEKKLDYLLLGQHYYQDDDGSYISAFSTPEKIGTRGYIKYARSVKEALETGYFPILAHPDVFFNNPYSWDDNCEEACDIILNAAIQTGTVLELNANGIRKGIQLLGNDRRWPYPYPNFWKKVAKTSIPVLIGSDAAIGQMVEPVELPEMREHDINTYDWAIRPRKAGEDQKVIWNTYYTIGADAYMDYLKEKYATIEANEQRWENVQTDDAEIVLVAYGISSRVCKAAVKKARAQGIKLGLIRPITLWPYPKKAFDALGDQVKGFLVVEMSILGQMCDDVVLACGNKHPVESYGEFANVPSEDVILERVQEMLKKY